MMKIVATTKVVMASPCKRVHVVKGPHYRRRFENIGKERLIIDKTRNPVEVDDVGFR
jgi:hypothetical protein